MADSTDIVPSIDCGPTISVDKTDKFLDTAQQIKILSIIIKLEQFCINSKII